MLFSIPKATSHQGKMLRIAVDEREQASGIGDRLRNLGVLVEYRMLEIADYVIGEYAVERKTVRDFISSLYSGRLFSQGYRLGETYNIRILIVEGDFSAAIEQQRNPRSLWGAMMTATFDFGLNTFFTPNAEQTAQLLYTLARTKKHSRPGLQPLIIRKPRSQDVKLLQLSVLRSLPGVGPQLANQLLNHFGSLKNVFQANTTEMAVGAKIGRIRALALTRLFNYQPSKEPRSQVMLTE